jgi:hypothetical protein
MPPHSRLNTYIPHYPLISTTTIHQISLPITNPHNIGAHRTIAGRRSVGALSAGGDALRDREMTRRESDRTGVGYGLGGMLWWEFRWGGV